MKQSFKNIFNLYKQNIVVTGGAGFLGSEFSLAVANAGAVPIILDINSKSLNKLQQKFKKNKKRGVFILVDLNNENKVATTINLIIKKYKKIDSLINATGLTGENMLKENKNFFEEFEKYDFRLWKKSLNANLSSIFIATQAVAKHMLKRKKGTIINIASDVGIISPDHRIYEEGLSATRAGFPCWSFLGAVSWSI